MQSSLMSAQFHDLSIPVVGYDHGLQIDSYLQSIAALHQNPQLEIIVVDSGSPDRPIEIARSFDALVSHND
jgi:glycosyltransferase involved in cell wall biosynthesis